jgi:hypothetical protein
MNENLPGTSNGKYPSLADNMHNQSYPHFNACMHVATGVPPRNCSLMPVHLGRSLPSCSSKEACNICSQEHNGNLEMKVEHVEF